jgi:hypothetical protein
MFSSEPVPLKELLAFDQGLREVKADRHQLRTEQQQKELRAKIKDLRQLRDKISTRNPEMTLDANNEISLQKRYLEIQNQFIHFLAQNPDSSQTELKEKLKVFDLSKDEEKILIGIFKELQKKRQRSQALLRKIKRSAETTLKRKGAPYTQFEIDEEAGRQLFKAITGTDPNSYIALIDNPFAVGIKAIDAQDVAKFEKRENIGGHYRDQAELTFGASLKLFFFKSFPLIFETEKKTSGITRHEQVHGENKAIQAGLARAGQDIQRRTWGLWDSEDKQNLGLQAKIIVNKVLNAFHESLNKKQLVDADAIAKKIRVELDRGFWDMTLQRAKDEVVADFDAKNSFHHYKALLGPTFASNSFKLGEDYLYTGMYFGTIGITKDNFINPQLRPVHDEIMTEYNQTVSQNAGYMESVWKVYSQFTDNEAQQKKQEILNFLRQNPINLWEERGKRLFEEDKKLVELGLQKLEVYKKQTETLVDDASKPLNKYKNESRTGEFPNTPELNSRYENFRSKLNSFRAARDNFVKELKPTRSKVEGKETEYLEGTLNLLVSIKDDLATEAEVIVEEAKKTVDSKLENHPITLFFKKSETKTEASASNSEVHQEIIVLVTKFAKTVVSNEGITDAIEARVVSDFIDHLVYRTGNTESFTGSYNKTLRTLDRLQPLLKQLEILVQPIIVEIQKFRLAAEALSKSESATQVEQLEDKISRRMSEVRREMRSSALETPLNKLQTFDQILAELTPEEITLLNKIGEVDTEIHHAYSILRDNIKSFQIPPLQKTNPSAS